MFNQGAVVEWYNVHDMYAGRIAGALLATRRRRVQTQERVRRCVHFCIVPISPGKQGEDGCA